MTATGPNRPGASSSGHSSAPDQRSSVIGGGLADALDRTQFIVESITLAVCAPTIPLLMIMVGRHGWPPAWLIVMGVLVAWVGDAVWALASHATALALARRRAASAPPSLVGHGHPWNRVGPPRQGADPQAGGRR